MASTSKELQDNFQLEYNRLNPGQKEAVNSIEGTVLVIAGPGSGKTQILTLRIANIIRSAIDISPSNILCLTYTESGAKTMKERLVRFIGENETRKVKISTFHGFCNSLREQYSMYFPEKKLAKDIQKIKILKKIFNEKEYFWVSSETNKLGNISEILRSISDLKRERKGKDYLKEQNDLLNQLAINATNTLAEERKAGRKTKFTYNATAVDDIVNKSKKLNEFYEVFVSYEKELNNLGLCDFDDLINDVILELKTNKEFSSAVQETYQYILVDEFQDTNTSQNEIVELLGEYWQSEGLSPNIFVVGDDDQSIYKFQGASVSNILDFKNKFPDVKIIVLQTNYRSSQEIINASRDLISKNNQTIDKLIPEVDKNYISAIGETGIFPKFINFSNDRYEQIYILNEIEKYVSQSNGEYKDIAILFRNNRDAIPFIKSFDRKKIPYVLNASDDLLTSKIVNKFLNILRVIHDPYNHEAFFDILSMPYLEIKLLSIYRLNHEINKGKKDQNLLEFCIEKSNLEEAELIKSDLLKIADFSNLLYILKAEINENSLYDFLVKVANETKFYEGILSGKIFQSETDLVYLNTNKINSFLDFVNQNQTSAEYNFENLISDIEIMKEAGFRLEEEKVEISNNGVKLLTAHSSKGAEFKNVFIVKSAENSWIKSDRRFIRYFDEINDKYDKQKISKEDDMYDEERRLFYVAMTRAKENLTITSSISQLSKPDGKVIDYLHFIDDISLDRILIEESRNFESDKGDDILFLNLDTKSQQYANNEENEFLLSKLKNLRFSATTLTSYLKCGYKYKLDYLVKIPQKKSVIIGLQVHNALDKFYKEYKSTSKLPESTRLVEYFKQELNLLPISENEKNKIFKNWEYLLSNYYEKFSEYFKIPFLTETNLNTTIDGIVLTGKIDKIELNERGNYEIVDYKTGKYKDISKVNPKTKNEHEYLTQLKFYKLLLESDVKFKGKVDNCFIDFIETDKKKNLLHGKTKGFNFNDNDLQGLVDKIKEVKEQMLNLHFEKTKDHSICRYCRHKDHCWPEGVPKW